MGVNVAPTRHVDNLFRFSYDPISVEHRTTFDNRDVSEIASKDPVLHQLVTEHRALDDRIGQFAERPYLSPTEEVEIRVLKKEKLLLRDQIQAILARHR